MDLKKTALWVIGAAVLFGGLLFLMRPAGGQGVEEASPDRIAQLLSEGVRVIDVRTPAEYAAGRLPGALNVPMNVLPAATSDWDRGESIIVYCATGARSSDAVRFLAEQGFETVHHFTDGISAWRGDLERGAEATEVPADTAPAGVPVMYEFFTGW